ncbi:uncharacterized protein F4822DRAFT_181900 [Hypoxylon trugodes]|uniref:uncharacterized protein n=1 Tax=Hypoxylon trugodes TaxID=326681 RepID=UPI0021907397|nr:uncharacterized protein F4822DRAFT_181900 [Hypoxylon trugodes]KAI1391327.1 hypothetical protein F4822DRAFT_181900 [Hypoxylon trugodes]
MTNSTACWPSTSHTPNKGGLLPPKGSHRADRPSLVLLTPTLQQVAVVIVVDRSDLPIKVQTNSRRRNPLSNRNNSVPKAKRVGKVTSFARQKKDTNVPLPTEVRTSFAEQIRFSISQTLTPCQCKWLRRQSAQKGIAQQHGTANPCVEEMKTKIEHPIPHIPPMGIWRGSEFVRLERKPDTRLTIHTQPPRHPSTIQTSSPKTRQSFIHLLVHSYLRIQ